MEAIPKKLLGTYLDSKIRQEARYQMSNKSVTSLGTDTDKMAAGIHDSIISRFDYDANIVAACEEVDFDIEYVKDVLAQAQEDGLLGEGVKRMQRGIQKAIDEVIEEGGGGSGNFGHAGVKGQRGGSAKGKGKVTMGKFDKWRHSKANSYKDSTRGKGGKKKYSKPKYLGKSKTDTKNKQVQSWFGLNPKTGKKW